MEYSDAGRCNAIAMCAGRSTEAVGAVRVERSPSARGQTTKRSAIIGCRASAGVPRDHVYDVTMYILAGMLVAGFVCNYLVKPLADKWFMKPEEVAALQAKQGVAATPAGSFGIGKGS
jgi:hypothetical protein